ncbi:MAG: hypothetical protein ACREBQ_06670, partial [Nitrososphaerales archaeon]
PTLSVELGGYKRMERWLSALGVSESAIAPHIQKLMNEFSPFVYIKSHPLGFRKGLSFLRFQLSATSSPREERKAHLALSKAAKRLATASKKLGASVRETR